jgi:hypothetical protein
MKKLMPKRVISITGLLSSCSMAFRRNRYLIVLTIAGLLMSGHAEAQLKIYYIRHAEGGHNVKKNWQTYSKIPEDQWPAYVGDPNVFTPMGKGQLNRVAGKLKRYKFDFIASSPIWRTRNTILPYMKEVGAKGEVWPELCEYWQSPLIISPDLPKPTVKILDEGAPIELSSEETPYFSLREDGLNEIKLPPFPKNPQLDNVIETAASQLVIQHVLDMIQERFGGTDATILLAGHGFSGKGILRMLTMDKLMDLPAITNTGIWMVEEQANGEFELKMFNDVPIEK